MAGDAGRAAWNSSYEKGLVEILHDYKEDPKYKGQNGWTSEGWRIITGKFNERFPVAHFTKQQIQEKEKELKANYKALKGAKAESGNGWNEAMCMIIAEPEVWKKIILNHPRVAKFRKKPFPLFYHLEALYEGSIAIGTLNFTSTQQVDAPLAPAPAPPAPARAPPPPAPACGPPPPGPLERSNSGHSIQSDLRQFGTNPFASSFDDQETSSALNDHSEPAPSAPVNSRQEEFGSGRRRKQSHVGSALEGYVEFKKSTTNRTLEALEEKKRHDEEYSVQKCVRRVDSIAELTDEEKSYALDLFDNETNRKIFMTTENPNVRLMWLKRKIRLLSGSNT